MASNGLPAGAFLTTIEGRRCTAVPRVQSATAIDANGSSQSAATNSPVQTTPSSTLAAIPVAGGNADANPVESDSTPPASTTSSSPVLLTSSIPSSSGISLGQATQERQSGPSALLPTPPAAVLPPAGGATLQSFTILTDATSSREAEQTSVVQSSKADSSVIAPAVDTSIAPTPPPLVQGPAATPLSTTIESPQSSGDSGAFAAPDASSTNPALTALPSVNSNAVQSTVAVAGGVIGGVVAISILAFFIWWWRRKLHRKRRSTLLTPLDAVPSFDRNEKGGYIITRGSIGPTPVAEKVKNVLGQNFRRFQGHLRNKTGGSAPSVNLDRGTSQFMDPKGTRGPANSGIVGSRVTTKDRFTDWWSRLTADMTFNWRLRAKPVATGNMTAGITQEKSPAVGAQPDFLTLLNMDDRELDREAQRRRASISRKNGSDGFLGGLNLNFGSSPGDNPFSDTNAIAHTSAKPAPLAIGGGQPLNPFSDANAIRDATMPPPKPSTYVADIRRSRGHSVSTSRQPSTLYYYTNRDSIYSAVGGGRGSVGAGDDDSNNFRNKFRSDPFDLERTISNNKNGGSVISSTAGVAGSEAS
ncbi:hypothetical protein N656DRAFT_696252, partial [Canariomyces notabilis]